MTDTQADTRERLQRARQALLARARELGMRLHQIEAELETHANPDWEEMAIAREQDEVLEGLGSAGQVELRGITAALARMRAGTFGICVECGGPISDDRLQVLPATPFCRSCAAQHG